MNPTRMLVNCKCGLLSGYAEVTPVIKRNGRTAYQLAFGVSGMFYMRNEDIICLDCREPALSRTENNPLIKREGDPHGKAE